MGWFSASRLLAWRVDCSSQLLSGQLIPTNTYITYPDLSRDVGFFDLEH
ncbi:MAG: hypothetical protein WCR21_06520 [Bacteroidota bacterium]